MKRVFYDSAFGRFLLMFSTCHTITIGPFVFSKLKETEMAQYVRNHECTHSRQWAELTMAAGLLILALVLLLGVTAWWLLLAPLVFYLWYGIEWFVRWAITHDADKAYRAVSFEQEAYANEMNVNYAENCGYFGWLNYLK